jgi:phenylacetic acid degradation operon negative regulatory protein
MKTQGAIDEFIAGREWSHEQPAHHHHILTVFGVYGRPAGKAIAVSALVRLLAELDAEPSSVRSSISRLKKRGVLVSKKTSAGNGYALFDGLEPHMQAGDERIFLPHSARPDDPWVLVSFSVPESERQKRHKLRTGLARMGFGAVNAGLYIGPARLRADAAKYIGEHRLWRYVELFIGQPDGLGDIRAKVQQWWNLQALAREYRAFVDAYRPDAEKWRTHPHEDAAAARAAFKLYVPMLTQWRRLPFLDPGLSAELLPTHWIGAAARQVFDDLNRRLKPLSARYFDEVLSGY